MADFLTDEEQAERLQKMWRDYGLTVLIGIAVGIGGIVAWNLFQDHRAEVKQRGADLFVEYETTRGLLGSTDEIKQQIEEQYPNSSYLMFVLMYEAKDAADEDDWELAKTHLEGALAIAKDQTYKDMISTRLGRVQFQLNLLDEALESVSDVGDAYRLPALELTGDVHRARGELDEAVAIYETALELDLGYYDNLRVTSKMNSIPSFASDDEELTSESSDAQELELIDEPESSTGSELEPTDESDLEITPELDSTDEQEPAAELEPETDTESEPTDEEETESQTETESDET